MFLIDWDGFEDDFVVALDAGNFDAVGLGAIGQLFVVLAEGVAESVDIDFRGSSDKGLSADEESRQEINARGLDDARHQVGKTDLCGQFSACAIGTATGSSFTVGVVANGAELGNGRRVGGREGCDF